MKAITLTDIERLRHDLHEELTDLFQEDHTSKLNWLIEQVQKPDEFDNRELFLIHQFILISATLHYAMHDINTLDPKDFRRLVENGNKILQVLKIQSHHKRYEVLCSEFFESIKKIHIALRQPWHAVRYQDLLTRMKTPVSNADRSISEKIDQAKMALDMQEPLVGLQLIHSIEENGLPEASARDLFMLKLNCLLLSGQPFVAERLLLGKSSQEFVKSEIGAWYVACVNALIDSDIVNILNHLSRTDIPEVRWLEAKLWLHAINKPVAIQQLPKAETIRKKFISASKTIKDAKDLYRAVQIVEECSSLTNLNLEAYLQSVSSYMDEIATLQTRDQLLVLVGLWRNMIDAECHAFADTLLNRYQSLCLQLSSGKTRDCLMLFKEFNRIESAPVVRSNIPFRKRERLYSISKLTAKSSMMVASKKMKQYLGGSRHVKMAGVQEKLVVEIYKTLSQLKGGLMKIGQLLSMAYIHDDAMRIHLSQLQTWSHNTSGKTFSEAIRENFATEPEKLFSDWCETPFAQGSIGQVHRATTLDGTHVAVKIKYDHIDEAVRSDLKLLQIIRPLLSVFMPSMDTKLILMELEELILNELDYGREQLNQMRYYEQFRNVEEVVVPRVHKELCNHRVLTSDFIEGMNYQQFKISASQSEKEKAALGIIKISARAFVEYQMFNADPHPGNFIFLPGGRVAMIDFGFVKYFEPEFVLNYMKLYKSVHDQNLVENKNAWTNLGFVKDEKNFDFERHFQDFSKLASVLFRKEGFTFDENYLVLSHASHSTDHPNLPYMQVPKDAVSLSRVVWGLTQVICELDVHLNIYEELSEQMQMAYNRLEVDLRSAS